MEFLDDSSDGETVEAPVKPGTVRIIVADSQAIYRVGIRKVFALEDDLRVVAQADTIENLRFAVEPYRRRFARRKHAGRHGQRDS